MKLSFNGSLVFATFLAAVFGSWLAVLAPPINLAWTAWFAYVPMLMLLRKDSIKATAWLSFVYGFFGNFFIFLWMIDTMTVFSSLAWGYALGILILYVAVLAFPFVLLFLSVHFFRKRIGGLWVFLFPALQVGLEYLSTFLFIFPYQHGVSQFQVPYVFQLVSLTGIWGLSFLILLVNAVIAEFFFRRLEGRSMTMKPLLLVSLLFCANYIYGYWQFNRIEESLNRTTPTRVLQLQNDINAYQWKARMGDRKAIFAADRYWVNETQKHLSKDIDLVVWPESSVSQYMTHQQLQNKLGYLSRQGEFELVLGGKFRKKNNDDLVKHNSAFMLNKSGHVQSRYDKMHLVPVSEYLPFKEYLPDSVTSIKMDSGHFQPGKNAVISSGETAKLAFPICYEAIFQSTFRRFLDVDLVLNITNDIWFSDTSGPYLHAMLAIVRAVEFGQPLYRAAYSGLSFYVEPHGQVKHQTQLFEKVSRVIDIRVAKMPTFYARYGDWFVVVCFVLILGGIFYSLLFNRFKSVREHH